MGERSRSLRAVLAIAVDEAVRRSSTEVAAEHLLLALTRRPSTSCALTAAGVTYAGLDARLAADRQRVLDLAGLGQAGIAPVPAARRARPRWGESVRLALRRSGHAPRHDRGAHGERLHPEVALLAGILASDTSRAARALADLGVDRASLRASFLSAPDLPRTSTRDRRLLLAGAAAGPAFMASLAAQAAITPGYDWVRDPASSLALGPHGWLQTGTFLVSGLACLAASTAMHRAVRVTGSPRSLWPLGVAAWGAGLVGAGLFTTDPVAGFPPGVDLTGVPTAPGVAHDAFSLLGFALLILSIGIGGTRWYWRRGLRGTAVTSVLLACSALALLLLASRAFAGDAGLAPYGGLLQRACVTLQWAWITGTAFHLSRSPSLRLP